VQQVQEMAADRIILGLRPDALAVVAKVVPVGQHRAKRGQQPVGNRACAFRGMPLAFGQQAAQYRHAGAQHIHRMGGGRQELERCAQAGRQTAQGLKPTPVAGEFMAVRQMAVDQQMGDFFELAARRDVHDVIAAIVQIIAGLTDRAQRGIGRHDAGERYGLLRLHGRGEVAGRGLRICTQESSPRPPYRASSRASNAR
jgi:hypothetical protein